MSKVSQRDGGYGWIIVFAFFFAEIIIDGCRFTFGIFFVEFIDKFGTGKGETAWIGSIVVGVYNVCGPIFSLIVSKLDCRMSSMIGACITALSFVLSYFATSIYFLYATYGALQGFGSGLMYMSGCVAVGRYFSEKRALALGLAQCGSGVGTFAFTPLVSYILHLYGWRGTLLLLGGLSFNICLSGALYRPFVESSGEDADLYDKADPANDKDGFQMHINGNTMLNNTSNKDSINSCESPYLEKRVINKNLKNVAQVAGKLSSKEPFIPRTFADMRRDQLDGYRNRSNTDTTHRSNMSVISQSILGSQASFQYMVAKGTRRNMKVDIEMSSISRINTKSEHSGDNDETLNEQAKDNKVFENVLLEQLFPKQLVTNINFIIMMTSCFLFGVGSFIPFSILPDYALEVGVSPSNSIWLVSALGIGGMLSRIGAGYLTDMPCVHRLSFLCSCFIVCGVLTSLVPVFTSFGLLVFYAFSHGLAFGATYIVQPVVLFDYFGDEYIAEILGILMFTYGFSNVIGTPIAGWLFDYTGNYKVSFLFAGGVFIAAGFIHLTVLCTKPSREARRLTRKQRDEDSL